MSGIQPVVTTVIVFVALTLTTVLGHEYSAHHQVSFSWLHIVIPFLWVVFFGWLFSPYFRSNGRVSMLPVVTLLTLTLIVVGITLPGKTKRSVLREIVQTTVNLTKNFNHTDHHVTSTRRREIYNDYNKLSFIDKIGHFVLFGCFTLLLVLVAAPVSKGILLLNLAPHTYKETTDHIPCRSVVSVSIECQGLQSLLQCVLE